MTVQRVRFYTSILTGLTLAAAAAAQSDRAFGQLEPGQTVVEINQADPFYDDAWSPVIRPANDPSGRSGPNASVEPEAQPEPKTIAGDNAAITPNVPPLGGFMTPQDIEDRQALADEASKARARQAEPSTAGLSPAVLEEPSTLRVQPPSKADLPIGAPTKDNDTAADSSKAAAAPSTNWLRDTYEAQNPAVKTMLALGLVILLIYALAWVYRKLSATQGAIAGLNAGKAPSGLLEVLGRYPIGNKQSLVLLKFDRRVLLLSQSPSGKGGVEMKTLCELNEPEDVASVLIKVRDADGDSLNHAFKSAMSKAEIGPAPRVVEPKPAARPTPRPTPVSFQVVPGHHDPFNGFGGGSIGPTRHVKANPDGDRAELWTDPDQPSPDSDPVAALRQRLEAMRRGERVT